MSEDHKPHDAPHDAGHQDDAHPVTPAHGHDDHAAAAPAHDAHGHGHNAHVEPAAPVHDDHGHADHGHEASVEAAHAAPEAHAHDDHTLPVADVHGHADTGHEAHGHEDHAPAVVAHDDHAHAAPTAPVHDDHAPVAHDDHGHAAPIAAAAVGGAAVAAAASHDAGKKAVWSDHGDAPFEDVDTTPVYARGKGGKRKAKSGGSAGSETVEIIKTIFFALLIALVLRVFLFQPFTIPSASMEPNLYEGDYIVVSKWSYGYSRHAIPFSPPVFDGRIMDKAPERGDIVVFKLPRDNTTDYIKRVIGLPGDRIQMINNQLFINGTVVQDVVVSRDVAPDAFNSVTKLRETLPGGRAFNVQDFGPTGIVDNTEVYTVPAGHYFMMGDNRDNSVDSRYSIDSGVGFVPAENLIGKAQIIMFSWEPGASLFNPVSWFKNIRPSRFFTVLD